MSETDNLVLEHLRAIRRDMTSMAEDIRALRTENTAFRQQMLAFNQLQTFDHGDIAALKLRVERLERRLDLVD